MIRSFVDGWADWMTAMAWQAGLLIVSAVALDAIVLRRIHPRLRSVVWSLVALKLVLPPGLASPLRAPKPAVQGVASSAAVPHGVDWGALACAVWLAGMTVLAAVAWRRNRAWRRSLQQATSPAPDAVRRLLREVCATLGLRRVPTLRLGAGLRSAAVVGLARPVILLPDERNSDADLHHVLLHEVAHIKRRDLWAEAAFALLHLVYWFHPLVAIARRRAHAAREVCCDLTVARALGSSTAYRETLLEHARRMLQGPRPAGAAAGFLLQPSTVLARLAALERHGSRPAGRATWLAAPAILLLAAIVLPMAAPQPPHDRVGALEAELEAAHARFEDTLRGDGRYGCFARRLAYYDVLRVTAELDRQQGGPDSRGTP